MYLKTLQMEGRAKGMAKCHITIISAEAWLTDTLVSGQLQCIGLTTFTKSCLNTHRGSNHSHKQTCAWVAMDTLKGLNWDFSFVFKLPYMDIQKEIPLAKKSYFNQSTSHLYSSQYVQHCTWITLPYSSACFVTVTHPATPWNWWLELQHYQGNSVAKGAYENHSQLCHLFWVMKVSTYNSFHCICEISISLLSDAGLSLLNKVSSWMFVSSIQYQLLH